VNDSPTLALNESARVLCQKGEPVIHLGIGEPKKKAPISAILHSSQELIGGDVKYTPVGGTTTLRRAISKHTEEHYNFTGSEPVGQNRARN
jgi:aspartate aminotransferase